MLIQFQNYLTFENIFLWSNIMILPFWTMLLIFPDSRMSKIFVNSIIFPLILAAAYSATIYQILLIEDPILNIFKLYLSIDNLYTIFATESFLLLFWLHFLTLNFFLGSWVSRDAIKYSISKGVVLIPLVIIFFFGPIGLVLYWLIRIFYSRRLGFHD